MASRISPLILALLIAVVAFLARVDGGFDRNMLTFHGPPASTTALGIASSVVALAFGVYHLFRARPPSHGAWYWVVASFAVLVAAPFVGFSLLMLVAGHAVFMTIPYAIALVGTFVWIGSLVGR